MGGEIQPFDPKAAVDAIRERVRGVMFDVIPAEQWDKLIRSEMAAFMEDRTDDRWGSNDRYRTIPSGFKQVVRGVLEAECKARVGAVLAGPDFQSKWESCGAVPGEAAKAIAMAIAQEAPTIIANMITATVQQVLSGMGNYMVARQ